MAELMAGLDIRQAIKQRERTSRNVDYTLCLGSSRPVYIR